VGLGGERVVTARCGYVIGQRCRAAKVSGRTVATPLPSI